MQKSDLIVIVSEDPQVCRTLTATFEARGDVVLVLDDGAELRDYVQLLLEQPHRRLEPRLVVVDSTVPGPPAEATAVWARHHGLRFPILTFREEAPALESVTHAQL